MPDARVYPIAPGSLIVLRGVEFDGYTLPELIDAIGRCCGHRQFVIMQIDDGADARVFGPDELVGWLRIALGIDVSLAPTAAVPKEYDLGRVEL